MSIDASTMIQIQRALAERQRHSVQPEDLLQGTPEMVYFAAREAIEWAKRAWRWPDEVVIWEFRAMAADRRRRRAVECAPKT